MSNLKLAIRRLLKTPLVTLVAVVSLGLGIGANAAIFSLFNQTLLRALPVPDPDRLVNLSAPGPKPGSQSCGQAGDCEHVFSYAMFKDLERLQQSFTGIAAHVPLNANLSYRNQTTSGSAMLVSGSYFPVAGVQPALGRLLGYEDDRTVGAHPVTVLSHSYWTTELGANPAVLNDTIIVNGQTMTIVGVAAKGFVGTTMGAEPELYVPLTMRGLMQPGWADFDNRRSYSLYLFARLKPGVSLEEARTALNGLYRPIINDVEAPLQRGISEQMLTRFRSRTIGVEPGRRGQSSVHGEARTPLHMLMAITAIVLLIACANIANLLLARAAGRSTEMAVRLSIGASRPQLLAQLLTEAIVLALIGGVAGLVIARWTLYAIGSILPAEVAASFAFTLDPTVVWFTMGLALLTGVLFGLFPALHSTRPDLVSTLKAQSGQPSGARGAAWFRRGLVTTQIALSMALLVSAGLFVRSLMNVSRVDLGVQVDDVITFRISPRLSGYDFDRTRQLFIRAEEALGAMPGVTGVGASLVPLLAGSNWGSDVNVQGFQRGPDTDANSRFNEVNPGYFRTLGIPLLAGREFTESDAHGAGRVAVVNEAFAKKFNLGRDAVGKRMAVGGTELNIEIVGLVQNAKYASVKQDVPPVFFLPYRQNARLSSMSFFVRTPRDAGQTMTEIRQAMARLDGSLPLEDLKPMPQQVRENVFMDRMISTLSAAFAVLATILAAVGLYGVLAYTVMQRTREFGLRMALGADGRRVRRLVLRQVGLLTLAGGVIGAIAAVVLGRYAESQLYQMTGSDPRVFLASAVILALVALAAGYIPAWRASRVDPMTALRYE